jgi:hypothetical protein
MTCHGGYIDMLDNAKGNTAEPRNLLRVLRQVPEASALGLLDATEPTNELTLAIKIQVLYCTLIIIHILLMDGQWC